MSRLYVPYWFISCPKYHLKKISNNISDLIYAQLKQDIFSFVLKPGQRFTETDLAERYAASRTPIRQALYRLSRKVLCMCIFEVDGKFVHSNLGITKNF